MSPSITVRSTVGVRSSSKDDCVYSYPHSLSRVHPLGLLAFLLLSHFGYIRVLYLCACIQLTRFRSAVLNPG